MTGLTPTHFKKVKERKRNPIDQLEMEQHIPVETFRKKLEADGGSYSIGLPGEKTKAPKRKKKPEGKGSGTFYCPMHCEGEKTYDKPCDCPVCGMDLVEVPTAVPVQEQFTCPMHPEIISDEMDSCPICGMDLVSMNAGVSEEDKTYKKSLRKLKVATVSPFLSY